MTEAERAWARRIIAELRLEHDLATALAAARAQGWREGRDAAAALIDKLYSPNMQADHIRAMKEPQDAP